MPPPLKILAGELCEMEDARGCNQVAGVVDLHVRPLPCPELGAGLAIGQLYGAGQSTSRVRSGYFLRFPR
jgi:hypothetical protein